MSAPTKPINPIHCQNSGFSLPTDEIQTMVASKADTQMVTPHAITKTNAVSQLAGKSCSSVKPVKSSGKQNICSVATGRIHPSFGSSWSTTGMVTLSRMTVGILSISYACLYHGRATNHPQSKGTRN